MENFGQRVIDLREKQGWTRRELAKRSGLHEQHILKIEQGLRKRIESDTIIRLARAFGHWFRLMQRNMYSGFKQLSE
jgi:transcriptional regulator with XRE-family HTH domain